MNTKALGRFGEDVTVRYLKNRGYVIFKRNYRSRFGEIDIIAEKDDLLLFVEVKARPSDAYVTGAEAVDIHKQGRIKLTALDFMKKTLKEYVCRFDVSEVTVSFDDEGNRDVNVNYIENAFM